MTHIISIYFYFSYNTSKFQLSSYIYNRLIFQLFTKATISKNCKKRLNPTTALELLPWENYACDCPNHAPHDNPLPADIRVCDGSYSSSSGRPACYPDVSTRHQQIRALSRCTRWDSVSSEKAEEAGLLNTSFYKKLFKILYIMEFGLFTKFRLYILFSSPPLHLKA